MKISKFCISAALSVWLAMSPANASEFGNGMRALAERIAEALSVHGLGRDTAADIYVRPPFDDVNRVVCSPLSRRLARALRSELPEAFARKRLPEARTVQRENLEGGQLILNVSWRQSGPGGVEITFLLGDLSNQSMADLGGGSVEVSRADFAAEEKACLAKLDVINRVETAEETLFVHRSASVFATEIGIIEKGQRYRLLGRMPYTDGNWAVVKLLDTGRNDPFAENVGFATIELPDPPAPEPEPAAMPEPEPAPAPEPAPTATTAPASTAPASTEPEPTQRKRRARSSEPEIPPAPAPQPQMQFPQPQTPGLATPQPQVPQQQVPQPQVPPTVSAMVGSWQCSGGQPGEQGLMMQLAFNAQFDPAGTYRSTGQLAIFNPYTNQYISNMSVSEWGSYLHQGNTAFITPQGSMPYTGMLLPYQMVIELSGGGSMIMSNYATNGRFECYRLN